MARDKQHDTLQTIFSFFVGIMVVLFIGVGVNTFYPQPADKFQAEIMKVQREMDRVYNQQGKPAGGGLTPSQQAEIDRLQAQMDDLQKKQQAAMEGWARNTSIVLVIFATIAMAVSLVRSEQLRVVSNGLLLGGVFTMIYGAGWAVASGSSYIRFFVVLFALVVTIALGYLKFVRGRKEAAAAAAAEPAEGAGAAAEASLAALDARLAAVEARIAAASSALGAGEE